MTTSEPDPRTDLAGWLGLTETQANICRRDARSGYADIRGILGARLVAQDQADTPDPEPDDGLIAVTVRLTPEQVRATAAIHPNSFNGRDDHGQSVCALNAACRAVDLPAPKPPWLMCPCHWCKRWVDTHGPFSVPEDTKPIEEVDRD